MSINMIRSCLMQYGYSFKSENNCCSVYMNKTFYGHTPNVNGLLNLNRSDTHIHNIDAKRCKVDNDSVVALPFRSYCTTKRRHIRDILGRTVFFLSYL